jgi:hypothetical protein
LGILFNNLRGSTSERWTARQIDAGKPGSPCPKGYLSSNTEFTAHPICTASRQYQQLKLKSLGYEQAPPADHPDPAVRRVYQKQCICDQLGNGALVEMAEAQELPVSVCPGPNIAYFDREYSLRELVDHIYGSIDSLVPAHRPHMFAKDLVLYVDYCEKLVREKQAGSDHSAGYLLEFMANLESGMRYYAGMTGRFLDENLGSLEREIQTQSLRLVDLRLAISPLSAESGVENPLSAVSG